MINIADMCRCLNDNGINFFTGVPDSYLNGFCNYIIDEYQNRNVIAANEGNAVAIAAGYYFATGNIPLVYMQNSGLGNAINPLASLVDKNVYNVPMLLIIGWRGQPGTSDWVQHTCQGRITEKLLDALDIPYEVLEDNQNSVNCAIQSIVKKIAEEKKTGALLVPKGVLTGDKTNNIDSLYELSRKDAIQTILNELPKNTIYLATTGRTTRELFYLREQRKESKKHDFLNVGAMGHTSSVALGMALSKPEKQIVVLDGDAACIMHMGAMTTISKYNVPNYLHIVLNNGAHESVGGQPSAGSSIDFTNIAKACGYETPISAVMNKSSLVQACNELMKRKKAGFIEVKIHKGLRGKLPSLKFSHEQAIKDLMQGLQE